MKRTILIAAVAALLAGGGAAADETRKLRVVATLPDVGSIAEAVGGDHVAVTTLARGYEDPHYVTPTPALMTAVSNADLFLEVGLSLEIWSERVLDGARNAKVRPGADGHAYVSRGVPLLEIPVEVTRAGGDLHPEGNPHVWLDPLNGILMARNVRDALIRVAPDRKAAFEKRCADFERRLYERLYGDELVKLLGGPLLAKLDRAEKLLDVLAAKKLEGRPLLERLGGLTKRAEAFRGRKIVFYHRSWPYFAKRFGLEVAGHVEDKPGIAPTAAHRDEIEARIRAEEIPVVAMTSYYPKKYPEAIAEATGAKLVVLPNSTGGVEGAGDYLEFLTVLVDRLAKAYGE